MDAFKKVLNVFGIILAVIFSFALVVSLAVAPTLFGANKFFQTENLKNILYSVDFETLVLEGEDGPASEDAALVSELFEAGMMQEFIELYVDDLFAQLEGSTEPKKLTEDAVMQIIENHMDVLVEMTKAEMDAETLQYVTDEEIADMLRETLAQDAASVAESFPPLSDMGLDAETIQIWGQLRDGLVVTVGLVLVAVFAVIVWVCQFPRFKSFMWLGVDFILGAGFTFVIAMALDTIMQMALAAIPFTDAATEPVMTAFTGTMKTGALIELGLAVVFIVIFIVGRMFLKKKATPQTV